MFSGLPPKADFPILELLPPPALSESLARRLVASARAYMGFVHANPAEYDIPPLSVKNVRVAVLRASD